MTDDRKFYETTVEVRVVSDEIPDADIGIIGLGHFIETGGGSGAITRWDSLPVTPAHARELLIQQNSSPEFLDLEDDDGPRKERLLRDAYDRARQARDENPLADLAPTLDNAVDILADLAIAMSVKLEEEDE